MNTHVCILKENDTLYSILCCAHEGIRSISYILLQNTKCRQKVIAKVGQKKEVSSGEVLQWQHVCFVLTAGFWNATEFSSTIPSTAMVSTREKGIRCLKSTKCLPLADI